MVEIEPCEKLTALDATNEGLSQENEGLKQQIAALTEKLRHQAAELAQSVEGGDYARAMNLINELSEVRDQSLYREVGRLTRTLHEAIRNFQIDPRSQEQKEVLSLMTDASDRFSSVIPESAIKILPRMPSRTLRMALTSTDFGTSWKIGFGAHSSRI